jgi:hypothetical protein
MEYSNELIDKICDMLSTSHKSIRTCCIDTGVSYDAFKNWINETRSDYHPYALTQYARAKDDQILHLADEILRLTYEMQELIRGGNAYSEINVNAAVANLRIQIDALKWLLSKLKPKKYGERLEVENTGTLTVKSVSFE